MYNVNKEKIHPVGEVDSTAQGWLDKNKDSLKYAGDKAKKSIHAGLEDAHSFMKDADEGTSFGKVQDAAVKWRLASDANDKRLANTARNEMIGHLSSENKETYLKDAQPLQSYIDAKDVYDYRNKSYTTTEFLDTTPDEMVRQTQQRLNELGYTDKFGEKLKEDGIFGGKTRYAKDNYDADNKQKSTSVQKTNYDEYDPLDYEVLMLDENGMPIKGEKFVYAGNPLDFIAQNRVAANTNKKPVLDKEATISLLRDTYTHESGETKWRKLPDVSERIPKEYKLYKEGKISYEIYKAMDILSQRWFYADTTGAREEIGNMAKSVRYNGYKVKDCTEDANKQLRDNAQEIIDYLDNKMVTIADYPFLGMEWYKKVRVDGIWDYKSKGADWIPKQKYFMYHGQIINDNDFGNINYGYTGTILGILPETLYKAGGKVNNNPSKYEINNYYSDSEVDHYWIKKGIEQANQRGYYGIFQLPVDMIFKLL